MRHSHGGSSLGMCSMRNLVFTIYCHRSETRTLLPDLEKVEHLKPAEVRQIGFTTHLYHIPSEIFSNTFKNFSGLAYTNVHNTPLTDSFYITNACPGRYCVFYVTGHYCIFYVIRHIVVLFYLYVSISVCVGLCITTCICPAFYAVILVISILLLLVHYITFSHHYFALTSCSPIHSVDGN